MTTVDLADYKIIVAAGTYDGVLAGWEVDAENDKLFRIAFASPAHQGSIRSVAIASSHEATNPGLLLSCGYDETMRTHDFTKKLTSLGEVRTPADFGTPICSSFAPPAGTSPSTHCLLGFAEGKLVIYKKRDWSVQHVLAGHEGGIAALATHPSGKMALTGGVSDGKLKLWDLTKGRLAYATKIKSSRNDPVVTLVWNTEGTAYAFGHGSHVTVRHVATGTDLLDVELPSKVNEICFMEGSDGLFVVVGCNDGSLPVLAVPDEPTNEILAIMAIEPVDGPVAGEERFKCIQSAMGYCVVTANSAGVISLMNLQGAVSMLLKDKNSGGDDEESADDNASDSEEDSDEEEDLAVDILGSTQLGTGARITCLSVWYCREASESPSASDEEEADSEQENVTSGTKRTTGDPDIDPHGRTYKRVREDESNSREVVMDKETLEKARKLVSTAKKIQKRKEKKKEGKNKRDSKSR